MSSITLAQIAEKPMTVATVEAISSFADSRQRRLAPFPRRNRMWYSNMPFCRGNIVAALSGDSDRRMG
jgi:hypothetical protein